MSYTVSWKINADLKTTDNPGEAVDYALETIGLHSAVLVEDDDGNRFEVDFRNGGAVRALSPRDPKDGRPATWTMWTIQGDELGRLREDLEGAHTLRIAVDEDTLKLKVNEDVWSVGWDPGPARQQ